METDSQKRKLEVVDDNGKVIGVETRENIHKKGLLHKEIHVWFYTPDKEIIFQHRAKDKDSYPDKLDVTVGGHVEIGDDFLKTAIKETREETGVKLAEDDVKFIKTVKRLRRDPDTGSINNAIRNIYAYCYRGNVDDLKIEKGKAIGFEIWPMEKIKNISEADKTKFAGNFTNFSEVLEILEKMVK